MTANTHLAGTKRLEARALIAELTSLVDDLPPQDLRGFVARLKAVRNEFHGRTATGAVAEQELLNQLAAELLLTPLPDDVAGQYSPVYRFSIEDVLMALSHLSRPDQQRLHEYAVTRDNNRYILAKDKFGDQLHAAIMYRQGAHDLFPAPRHAYVAFLRNRVDTLADLRKLLATSRMFIASDKNRGEVNRWLASIGQPSLAEMSKRAS